MYHGFYLYMTGYHQGQVWLTLKNRGLRSSNCAIKKVALMNRANSINNPFIMGYCDAILSAFGF